MSNFWIDTVPPGYYDKILEKGIKAKKGIQPNWHHSTFTYVSKHIDSKDIHLDYACGSGSFIGKYIETTSIGVDISHDQIKYASNKYKEKGNFVALDHFNYKDYEKYFNKITVIGLFEFIKNDEILDLLNKLYFMLSDEGTILLTTPNYRSAMPILQSLVNKLSSINYENQHINKFNENKLIDILSKSKFNNVKVYKIINFGVFFGYFSLEVSEKLQNLINKITFGNFGYLLLGVLQK